MSHTEKRTMTRRARFTIAFVAMAVMAVALMPLFAQPVSAATGPKAVRGYVEDSIGNRLEGALVVVNIRYQSDQSLRATDSFTTGSNGYYSITFAMTDWDIGDTIEVIATWNSNQKTNTTIANSAAFQDVWIIFPFAIPQFGSHLGTIAAIGAVGAVGAVFVVSKKRRKDE